MSKEKRWAKKGRKGRSQPTIVADEEVGVPRLVLVTDTTEQQPSARVLVTNRRDKRVLLECWHLIRHLAKICVTRL
jgi:hypothetical protein